MKHRIIAILCLAMLMTVSAIAQNQKMTAGFQHTFKGRYHLLMIKIPKALTGCNNIKSVVRKSQFFRWHHLVVNFHSL